MSAIATMRDATASGHTLSLEGDALRCRPTPGPELLAQLREHKAEIVGILRRQRCCDCAAEPGPVEIGGFGLNWWRCDACTQAHLGLSVARAPEQLDMAERDER